MDIQVKCATGDVARKILAIVGPEGRRSLFSVAAKALSIEVKDHIRSQAGSRHRSAARLDARPTGHLTKGARAITSYASVDYASVSVPIPGITRAFHDLVIRPVKAPYLTLPAFSFAYGRTAREMKALGWSLFRGRGSEKAEHLLFGRRGKGRSAQTNVLFILKDEVTVPQDRTLLPSDDRIAEVTNGAIRSEIQRVAAKAMKMGAA